MSNPKQPIIQNSVNKTLVDKWVFVFNLPDALKKLRKSGVTGKGIIDLDSVQFTLKGVKIPDITVKAVSQRYASGNLYISSHSKDPFDLLVIRFDIDNTFANWMTIYEWLNLLHDEKEAYPDPHKMINERWAGVESYWTDLAILGLDEYNNTKIRFTFTQAFPTFISGINYDYTQDTRIDATANFAFSQIHVDYPQDVKYS